MCVLCAMFDERMTYIRLVDGEVSRTNKYVLKHAEPLLCSCRIQLSCDGRARCSASVSNAFDIKRRLVKFGVRLRIAFSSTYYNYIHVQLTVIRKHSYAYTRYPVDDFQQRAYEQVQSLEIMCALEMKCIYMSPLSALRKEHKYTCELNLTSNLSLSYFTFHAHWGFFCYTQFWFV